MHIQVFLLLALLSVQAMASRPGSSLLMPLPEIEPPAPGIVMGSVSNTVSTSTNIISGLSPFQQLTTGSYVIIQYLFHSSTGTVSIADAKGNSWQQTNTYAEYVTSLSGTFAAKITVPGTMPGDITITCTGCPPNSGAWAASFEFVNYSGDVYGVGVMATFFFPGSYSMVGIGPPINLGGPNTCYFYTIVYNCAGGVEPLFYFAEHGIELLQTSFFARSNSCASGKPTTSVGVPYCYKNSTGEIGSAKQRFAPRITSAFRKEYIIMY